MRHSSTITHGIFCGHHFLKAHDGVVPGLNLEQFVTPFPAQPRCCDNSSKAVAGRGHKKKEDSQVDLTHQVHHVSD